MSQNTENSTKNGAENRPYFWLSAALALTSLLFAVLAIGALAVGFGLASDAEFANVGPAIPLFSVLALMLLALAGFCLKTTARIVNKLSH